MDRRVRDSVNYNRDYQQFIQNLQKFHGSRGSAFKRVPFFGGKELDLYLLYKTVTSLGGCAKVTDEKKWRDVAKCFNLPASCTNAAFSLRQYYLRYLSSYERLHFLGEDGDDNSIELRRSISSSFMQSSMNFMPYNIQDPVKKVVHGPLGEPKVHNFDRLIFSLMSGLPNEVDFALNICTLLSNVTNSIFNLAKAPTIVDLMLAHVGIFTEGEVSMRELYKEWYQESDRDFDKFWRESIDDETVKEIYDSSCSGIESECRVQPLQVFTDRYYRLGESVEAKRVNQICVILHNFSYEELNRLFISTHSTCIRFLMLCAGSKLTSLRKMALDALDNVADKMTLGSVQEEATQIHLRMLHSFMFSKDRSRKVRGFSILAKLSGQQENEDVLSEAISQDVYEELIKCLTIPDIQLILNALDALYFLSDLGEATATAVVMVNKSIDILVCLTTVHAESYGNRAISGFRIVENKNSVYAQKQNILQQSHNRKGALQQLQRSYTQLHPVAQQQAQLHQQVRTPPKTQVGATNYSPLRPDAQKQDESEEVEPEIFAARWISAFYELSPGNEIKRSQIFADYVESCKDLSRKATLNIQSFFKILGLVIPAPYWRFSDTSDPAIAGIKRRTNPLIVKNKSIRQQLRAPDAASTHTDQTVPVRPIPVVPTITSHSQIQHRMPFGVQQAPQVSVSNTIGLFPGQVQGTRPALAGHPSGSVQVPTSSVPIPINNSGLPLKLLEEHVNSQGHNQDLPVNAAPVKRTMEANGTKLDSTTQQQQHHSQESLQPPSQISQTETTANTVQGQTIVGSSAQVQQNILLQSNATGISINVSDTNAAVNQSSLDPNSKLNSQQKLSAKERNERKKAVKAARDMINADIKASNLDPLTQCQNLTERIQKEMQQHFVQFHVHQQNIQAIQAQLQQLLAQNQQSKLPQNIMDGIHTRVRNHHAQMQIHYSKLQQLQILLQQVKIRISQEQNAKEQAVVMQDSVAAEVGNQALRKTPRTPRILRKQTAITNAASPGSDVTLSQTRLQQMPPESVAGIATPTQQMNAMVAPNAAQLTTQIGLLPSIQNNQATASTSNFTPTLSVPAVVQAGVSPSPVALPNENAKEISLPHTTGVPNQVAFFSNTTALQGQTSNLQLAPTALAATGKQSGAHIIQKPVAVTYNTPILPRPSTSTLQQNAPNSAVVGQTVLFTMPVVQLPQQRIYQASSLPQSSNQQNTSFSSNLVEAHFRSNALVSSTSVTVQKVQSDIAANSSMEGQSGGKNQVGIEANTKSLGGAIVQSSSMSQGIMSHVVMPSVQPQSTVFNGPHKTLSTVSVNGSIENVVGKGPQKLHDTEFVVERVSNLSENGQVNGFSEGDASLSTVQEAKGPEEENASKIDHISGENCGLVNGGRRDCNVNGTDKVQVTMSGMTEKRKLDDSNNEELRNCETGRVDDDDSLKLESTEDSNKCDVVVRANKKLKINGIYVNCIQRKDGDDRTESMEVGESEECQESPREQNGLMGNMEPDSNKGTDGKIHKGSISCVQVDDTAERHSQRLVNDKVDITRGGEAVEDKQSSLMDNEEETGDSRADKQDKACSEKKTFNCQWGSCKGCFSCMSDLLAHMVLSHAPQEGSFKTCKVSGCKPVKRPRGSMICHFSQVHCNRNSSADDDHITLPQLLFPKVVDLECEDESPVTRSVRLTAALVLRNVARNSSYGRKIILKYESRLSPAAMSSSEASSAIAACLEELTKKRRKSSDIMEEDDVTS